MIACSFREVNILIPKRYQSVVRTTAEPRDLGYFWATPDCVDCPQPEDPDGLDDATSHEYYVTEV